MIFWHSRWPVFHEDNHLLVLYKPAGLIMQRDARGKANLLDLAKHWIKRRYAKPGRVFVGMVHRLDAPVAGVLVLARTSKAAGRLSAQFRDGLVDKRYWAVVRGRPPDDSGRLVNRLVRKGRYSRMAGPGAAGAREARLRYRRIESRGGRSLLEIALETGRRHQIRAQLAGMGCPILGDVPYGAKQPLAHGRIALLARELAVTHPTRSERLHFRSPIPQGWPWTIPPPAASPPLWTIEEYLQAGLELPAP